MKVNVLKKVSTASSVVEAKNRDQAIKEFLSIEVLRNIKDKAVESVVRDIIFKVAKSIDWEQALKSALHYSPDLTLKLKDYKLESSVITSTTYRLDELEIVENLGKDKDWEDVYFVLVKKDDDYAVGTYNKKKKFVLIDKDGWKDIPEIAIADFVGWLEETAQKNNHFYELIRNHEDFDFGDGKYSKIFKSKYNAMIRKYR